METSFVYISPSRWVIISLILGALSFFMPRRIPFIIAGSSFVTASVSFIYPFLTAGYLLSTAIQLAIFSVALILGLLFIQMPTPSTVPIFKKADILTLESPIKKGRGQFKTADKIYTLIGPDCPVTTQVTVVSVQKDTLYVNPLTPEELIHD